MSPGKEETMRITEKTRIDALLKMRETGRGSNTARKRSAMLG
jgi:hypothetical protein